VLTPVILAVGISDLVVAALLARSEAGSSSGLAAQPSPVAAIVRWVGIASVAVGAVLIVGGLAS